MKFVARSQTLRSLNQSILFLFQRLEKIANQVDQPFLRFKAVEPLDLAAELVEIEEVETDDTTIPSVRSVLLLAEKVRESLNQYVGTKL